MLSTKTNNFLALAIFSGMFLVTRIPFLGYDEINPDAVNWHFRSEQFIVGLKTGDFSKTYQHYHPGVTLMWLMGVPIELNRQLNPQDRVYTEANFLRLHQLAKYSLIAAQLALSVVLLWTLKAILGLNKSLITVSLFTFEPFFLGNSRLLHMDVLLSLLIILSLTCAYKHYLHRSVSSILLAGFFAGLACLTKSVGLATPVFIALCLLILAARTHTARKQALGYIVAFLAATVGTVFMLFPALWINPTGVLSDIYSEGLRVGTRRGHEQVILGDAVDVAGPGFYPLVLALKTSPLIWLGVSLTIWQCVRNRRKFQDDTRQFSAYVLLFYLLYLGGMSMASKKLDRYMIPLFPALGIVAMTGITNTCAHLTTTKTRRGWYFSLALVTGIGVVYPSLKLYPYYFTYTNPVFGSATAANAIVGQKPFGIAIPELKQLLAQRYGANVPLGFIDRKPMAMIYPNSKVFDIREAGTANYTLLILGPNEPLPENVLTGKYKFALDYTMYINGLDFWRVYKKTSP
jgi:4-amino-4-deoxy-L-arabinose transferase-like glycosyltransferase